MALAMVFKVVIQFFQLSHQLVVAAVVQPIQQKEQIEMVALVAVVVLVMVVVMVVLVQQIKAMQVETHFKLAALTVVAAVVALAQ
jgi:hypothetical protein